MTKLNATTATNAQIAEHFEMTADPSGMPYAFDAKGRRHFITDLRTRLRKEATKKKAAKVRKEAAPTLSADELLAELQPLSTDFWSIRESQPGCDIESHGMQVYVTAGAADKHRVMIRSNVVTKKEIEREFGNRMSKMPERVNRKKATLIISGISTSEIVEIIDQFKSISE